MKFDSNVVIGTRAYLKQNTNARTTDNNNSNNGFEQSRQQSFHQGKIIHYGDKVRFAPTMGGKVATKEEGESDVPKPQITTAPFRKTKSEQQLHQNRNQ
jgi:hypothetical protein